MSAGQAQPTCTRRMPRFFLGVQRLHLLGHVIADSVLVAPEHGDCTRQCTQRVDAQISQLAISSSLPAAS